MKAELSSVKTGEITTAVRDTTYKEMEIKKDEYIGLAEGDLIVNGTNIFVVLKELLEKIIERKGLLITLYHGEAIDAGLAEELTGKMQDIFAEQDFELQYGGQPVYHFIISAE
ncbi:MAG: Dak phosphatase, partial [Pelotomaculum thermopropionicum]